MQEIIQAPAQEETLNDKVRHEQIRTLCANGPASFLISIVNAILVFIVLRDSSEPIVLYSWTATIIILSLFRTIMVAIFWRLNENGKRYSLWTATYLLLIYGSAACWGILPLWEGFSASQTNEAFIIFVVAGMSAGGLVSLYSLLQAALPYLMLLTLPLVYALASSDLPAHYEMATLVSLYLMLLINSTYKMNRVSERAIRLEIENGELFQFLVKTKQAS